MRINLNDPITIGRCRYEFDGSKTLTVWKQTRNIRDFAEYVQFVLDVFPNTDDIVIVHEPTQTAFRFKGFAKYIGMKSRRFEEEV